MSILKQFSNDHIEILIPKNLSEYVNNRLSHYNFFTSEKEQTKGRPYVSISLAFIPQKDFTSNYTIQDLRSSFVKVANGLMTLLRSGNSKIIPHAQEAVWVDYDDDEIVSYIWELLIEYPGQNFAQISIASSGDFLKDEIKWTKVIQSLNIISWEWDVALKLPENPSEEKILINQRQMKDFKNELPEKLKYLIEPIIELSKNLPLPDDEMFFEELVDYDFSKINNILSNKVKKLSVNEALESIKEDRLILTNWVKVNKLSIYVPYVEILITHLSLPMDILKDGQ